MKKDALVFCWMLLCSITAKGRFKKRRLSELPAHAACMLRHKKSL